MAGKYRTEISASADSTSLDYTWKRMLSVAFAMHDAMVDRC
jgi:hypothetical protein